MRVELKIGLLLMLAIATVIATGYLSYKSLSSIVSSIEEKAKPDLKIEHIREIATRLENAENGIRAYLLTSNKKALRPYFKTITHINSVIDSLKLSSKNDQRLYLQLDTLNNLIDRKMEVWKEMLLLSNDEEIKAQYLEIEKILNPRLVKDTVFSYQKTKILRDTIIPPKSEEKKGFLQRLFGKNDTENEQGFAEDLKDPESDYDIVEIPIFIEKAEEIDKEKIKEEIEKLKELDTQKQQEIKERDFKLAQTSFIITVRLYQLIEKIERDEWIKTKEKIEKAESLANTTYKWLAWFSVSGTLMAIMIIFILVKYTRKTRAYQKALVLSKTEAERLAKTREIFIANVSHEIRTPLNAITGFTSNLIKKQHTEEVAKDLGIIKTAGDHLLRMIDDVLDFSKLQAEKLKLEYSYFSVNVIFEDLYNLFLHRALEKKIRFFYTIGKNVPEVLYGDPYRLKQILINLINNSLKFTKEGEVSFSVESIRTFKNSTYLKFNVNDTGLGIEKDKIKLIFDEFVQEDVSFSRKYGGTGLGLSIVKKLVELHNGKIEIESSKNKGTSIHALISYKTGDLKKIDNQLTERISLPDFLKGKKVLIVDDNEYNRLLLKKLLENNQMLVEDASDGNQTFSLLEKSRYDLILLDIRLPDTDGFKISRIIRESANQPNVNTPIIILSAAVTEENIQKAKEWGIRKILPKPFSERELFESIILNVEGRGDHVENTIKEVPLKNHGDKLNIDAIFRVSGNQQDFVIEMLDKFNEMMEQGLTEMTKELDNVNFSQVKEVAHKIAPPCQHIGALKLKNILKDIENLKTENELSDRGLKLINYAKDEFQLVKKEIDLFLSQINT